jgi:hypothetical protein
VGRQERRGEYDISAKPCLRAFMSSGAIPVLESTRRPETAGLLESIAPLMLSGLERVEQGAQALAERHPGAPFDSGTVKEVLVV